MSDISVKYLRWVSRSLGMFFVITALLLAPVVYAEQGDSKASELQHTKNDMLKLRSDDLFLGDGNAPVTMLEYQAITCPHCSHFERDVLPKIKERFIDNKQVLFIVRDYPVDEQSFKASLIITCLSQRMSQKERAMRLRSVLLSTQRDWWGKKNYLDIFKKYAAFGGVDESTLSHCIEDTTLQNQVLSETLATRQVLGVHNIPTFFINGKQYEGSRPWEFWETLINNELNEINGVEHDCTDDLIQTKSTVEVSAKKPEISPDSVEVTRSE